MLRKLDITRAETDVRLALFELGFVDTIDAPLDHALSLRDDLGLDSLELVSLAETLSGLATGTPPLDGQAIATVGDCVAFIHDARDPWLPTDTPYVLQGSLVIRRPAAEVYTSIAFETGRSTWPMSPRSSPNTTTAAFRPFACTSRN